MPPSAHRSLWKWEKPTATVSRSPLNPSMLFGYAAVVGIALSVGCTVGPHYHPPAAPSVTAYEPATEAPAPNAVGQGSLLSQHMNPDLPYPNEWWAVFQCGELNQLVHTALQNSPTLAQTEARLRQAQEAANARTGQTKYPNVSGSISAQREQVDLAAFGVPYPSPPPFGLLNGSVAVSYALDIFGANRRLIEGLNAQVDFQRWQVEGARLMLAGNVVTAVIRQAQVRAQIELTHRMVATQEKQLSILEQQIAAGGRPASAAMLQRTLLAQTKASLPPLEQELSVLGNQLAVLLGKTPAEAKAPAITLEQLHLPDELPLSLPSALVRQRPDILAAESLMHQASANVGVATAALYPQITLTASAGLIGTSFTSGGDVWNLGAALAQPIFNGGALRAEKRKAVAAYDEASANYQQVVLQAFEQVADSLRAIDSGAQTVRARTDAASQAQASLQVATERVRAGGMSQSALLDAERQYLQTQMDLTAAYASRFADSSSLLQALGGGWWTKAKAPTVTAPKAQSGTAQSSGK